MSETLGETIRRVRLEHGMSLADLARRAYTSRGYLSKVERNKQVPSDSLRAALANALGIGLPAPTRSPYPGWVPTSDSIALVLTRQPDGSVIIVPMDRRAFLATAGVVTAAAVTLPDRLTPDVVTALSDRLDWHIAAGRVSHPETVSEAVRADLDEITAAVRLADKHTRAPLLMLGARYSEYLGWMRQEADDLAGALRWTNHAADLATAAEWRQMVAYTYTRKAFIVLDTDPRHATELARAVRTRPSRTSPALTVLAASQEAEGHARIGQANDTHRALDLARRYAARDTDSDGPPIGPRSRGLTQIIDMRAARCDLLLGRPERAITLLAPVLAGTSNPRLRAIDGPRLAAAYARVGAVEDACRTALDAVRTHTVSAQATRELRALRPELQLWAGRSEVDQVLAALPA